jgi:HlyD family secretion protein
MALVLVASAAAVATVSCTRGESAEGPSVESTAPVRGDLRITAEATGTVEPIRRVEVKSKASGEVQRLHVDVGDLVEPGTLLAEIDPRDVRNNYEQTAADLEVAEARAQISRQQLERQRELLAAGVITQQELEAASLEAANAEANLIKARTNEDLAQLQLNDVTIRAPLAGTILTRNVEQGTVIQSASQNVSGGTVLFEMATLEAMQVRTLVDETDMGQLRAGMETEVRVEAYPERAFAGTVAKIEPQAVVEQNVTMFPVIVTLDNRSGLLKPGMNAEVEILIDESMDVLLVPNNAVVNVQDVGPAAMALGLDPANLDLEALGLGGRAAMAAAPISDEDAEVTESADVSVAVPGRDARKQRPAAVFVLNAQGVPEPRRVMIGLNDWDNTEVVSGLEGDEQLAVIGPAQLQAQQQEWLERIRSRSGGSPLGGGSGPRMR